jgi:hypothetical protein
MTTSIIPFSAELAQQLMESTNGFPVDFDLAWVWSGYNSKAKGLKALRLYFSEGEDFLPSGQKVSTGGRIT